VTSPVIKPTETSIDPNQTALRPGVANLLHDDSGQDLIEYALLAALIGLTAATAVRGLSTKISSAFTSVGTTLTSDT
jgi:pilus assembly protein Flp/PilA